MKCSNTFNNDMTYWPIIIHIDNVTNDTFDFQFHNPGNSTNRKVTLFAMTFICRFKTSCNILMESKNKLIVH